MSQSFRWTLLWLAAAALGATAALMMLSMSYFRGEFYPATPDAMYHARRVLDAVFSGQPVIQFDPKIHVPEGSWLTWPWGFDQLLAWITRGFGPYPNESEANRVLLNIPPVAFPIAIGIVVIIARQLALPLLLAALLAFGFAALPVVYMQFGVGNIDHHFAELMWTLATVSTGLWFFRQGKVPVGAGVALGFVLGSALAIHNGLFILQLPVAITLGQFWLRDLPLPDRRRMLAFAISLVLSTLLVCIPSEPWRRGFFEFYTLSWFHFYVSACVAIFSMAAVLVRRSNRNLALLAGAAILALLPLIGTLPFARDFVSGDLASIQDVDEAKSPYRLYQVYGEAYTTRLISWLMWISAPLALLNLWWVIRRRETQLQFLAITGLLGLLLMQAQYRFSVFGVLPMLLTPVLATRFLVDEKPQWRVGLSSACVALMLVAFIPTAKNWQQKWMLGNYESYANLVPGFPVLRQLCAERPGVVLADINMGHWVRYHSDCPVIGDVFLLTPQHARKANAVEALLRLTPQELLDAHLGLRYVFVFHAVHFGLDAGGRETPDLDTVRMGMRPMERELLGPEERIPAQFRQRWESRTPAGRVFARLYEIVPGPAPAQ